MDPFVVPATLGLLIVGTIIVRLIRSANADAEAVRVHPRVMAVAARPGLVHLRGRVAPERTAAHVEGPLGSPGVFVRVLIERLEPKSAGGRGGATPAEAIEATISPEWTVLHREDQRVPFLLDDGSGEVMVVDLEGAKIVSDRRQDVISRPETPDERVLEVARARLPDAPLATMVLRLTVETFVEGDEISILGLAEDVAAPASVDPYRSASKPPRLRVVRPREGVMLASHTPLSELAESGRLQIAE